MRITSFNTRLNAIRDAEPGDGDVCAVHTRRARQFWSRSRVRSS
jgi:hypothetical protein